MTRIQIIVYSLSFSFFFTQNIMTFLRKVYLSYKRQKEYKEKGEFSHYNQLANSVNRKIKPLDCMPCMTGWFSLGMAISCGYGLESILIMFLGYFIGAIFE